MFRLIWSSRRSSITGRKSGRPRVETLEARLVLSNFNVLNANDSGPDSLREAILDANAAVGADTIGFNIPGAAVPTLTSVTVAGSNTTVLGTVSGAASSTIRVDLYANAPPPQGVTVQGQTPVLTLQVPIGASGTGAFTATFPTVPAEPLITATATSPANTASPFSAPATASSETVPDLEISLNADISVPIGQDVSYAVGIANIGTATATGLTLTDPLPAGATFVSATLSSTVVNGVLTFTNLGNLAPGETINLNIVLRPSVAGTLTNSVTVTQAETDPTPDNNTFTLGTRVTGPALDGTLTGTAPESVTLGQDVTYTLTATYTGSESDVGGSLTDTLPPNAPFVSATGNPTLTNGVLTFILGGSLNSPDTFSFTIVVHPTVAGSLLNVAKVQFTGESGLAEKSLDQNTIVTNTTAPSVDLVAGLSAVPSPATVGQNLTYTVVITNTAETAATGVTLSDHLPANVAFVSASRGSFDAASGILTASLGAIAGGGSSTVTVVVQPTAAVSLTNVVTVSGDQTDPNPGNNTASHTATAIAPSVDLVAGLSAAPSPGTVGQNLTYTVVITNTAETAATGVTLVDHLPANVVFVSASRGSFDAASGILTASLGAIASGGSTTVTIVVRPVAAGSLTNVATVSGEQTDPNVGNNTASHTTTAVVVKPVENGPRVVSLQRFGYHMQPTLLVLTFDRALDPVNAVLKTNYRIVDPGRDGKFGTRDDRVIPVKSAALDPSGRIVVLTPAVRLPLFRTFKLTINGTGSHSVTDASGRLLDGDRNGVAGGAFASRINRGILAGPASAVRSFAMNNNSGSAAKRRKS
jgi:uncharacterized repeat protein (TIGR01451 family)